MIIAILLQGVLLTASLAAAAYGHVRRARLIAIARRGGQRDIATDRDRNKNLLGSGR